MTDSPRYQAGDAVVVRVDHPLGHYRTPDYVKGKTGQVVALCGVFKNPESLGHGGSGLPQKPLYRVEFSQADVWEDYAGPNDDKVLVDIYEHWLEPATG